MWLSVAIQCFLVALAQLFMRNKNHTIYENPFEATDSMVTAEDFCKMQVRPPWGPSGIHGGDFERALKKFHISTCLYLWLKSHKVLHILCFIFAKHFTMNFGTWLNVLRIFQKSIWTKFPYDLLVIRSHLSLDSQTIGLTCALWLTSSWVSLTSIRCQRPHTSYGVDSGQTSLWYPERETQPGQERALDPHRAPELHLLSLETFSKSIHLINQVSGLIFCWAHYTLYRCSPF